MQIQAKIKKVPPPGHYFSARDLDVNKDGKVTRDEILMVLAVFRRTKAAKIQAAKAKGTDITPGR